MQLTLSSAWDQFRTAYLSTGGAGSENVSEALSLLSDSKTVREDGLVKRIGASHVVTWTRTAWTAEECNYSGGDWANIQTTRFSKNIYRVGTFVVYARTVGPTEN